MKIKSYAYAIVAEALLAVVVGAVLLSCASRASADQRHSWAMNLLMGAVGCFFYFWPGLVVAGALSGLLTKALAYKTRAAGFVGIAVPILLLPVAVVVMVFRRETGWVPLIQNANDYVYWATAAGALVGVGMLLLSRMLQRRQKSASAGRSR